MRRLSGALFLTTAALVTACARTGPSASTPDASPSGRRALGAPTPYAPETLTSADGDRLKRSILERRALAWKIVAKALAPATTTVSDFDGAVAVPAWATWNATDDFKREFHKLYDDLGVDKRRDRVPFAPAAVDGVDAWNASMVTSLPDWTEERYQAWVASLGSPAYVRGLTTLSRTLFAPAVTRHVLGNYKDVNDCLDRVAEVPFADPGRAANNFSLCYADEFPAAAAVVKTAWVREGLGIKVKTYDTDAAALTARLQDGVAGWDVPERSSDPLWPGIYTVGLESGTRFRLAGMHIMTKELREWVWITLWWSDRPDSDFGEDRPDEIRALGAPWDQYKMCVVVGFDEEGAVDDEMRTRYPTLAAALTAASDAVGPSSWCSNPYVERGAHNQRSNCIGCHQHAGTGLDPATILADDARFPAQGRKRVRENFPSDYLWSFDKDPERWASLVRNEISYYDLYDPLTNPTPPGG